MSHIIEDESESATYRYWEDKRKPLEQLRKHTHMNAARAALAAATEKAKAKEGR